jgi:hypothetical protein
MVSEQERSLVHYSRPTYNQIRIFFWLHAVRKHQKKFPCYKRYKNLDKNMDEKAKCQPWNIKKKPKFG